MDYLLVMIGMFAIMLAGHVLLVWAALRICWRRTMKVTLWMALETALVILVVAAVIRGALSSLSLPWLTSFVALLIGAFVGFIRCQKFTPGAPEDLPGRARAATIAVAFYVTMMATILWGLQLSVLKWLQ